MTTPAGGSRSHGSSDTLGTVLSVSGVVLAISVTLFQPALPYEIDNLLGIALLLGSSGMLVWLIILLMRWWQQHHRPAGLRRLIALNAALWMLLTATAMEIEETGIRRAHCEFGVHGLGYGMVWAKIEPREPGKRYQFTVLWGDWIGRPAAVVLNQATYFTFLKRDFYSRDAADVTVDRDAKITCGDGRPASSEEQIHLVGADWTRGKPSPAAKR